MKANVAVRGLNVTANIRNVFSPQNVADEYANWIASYPWTWFVTFTTPYELTLKSARRAMERYFTHTSNLTLNPQMLFWVAEPFECKDGYHTHGLFYSDITFKKAVEAYQITSAAKRHGNYARIHLSRYNPRKAAARYCAKYLLKRYSDYDLLLSR